jgi:hypothetical protein
MSSPITSSLSTPAGTAGIGLEMEGDTLAGLHIEHARRQSGLCRRKRPRTVRHIGGPARESPSGRRYDVVRKS